MTTHDDPRLDPTDDVRRLDATDDERVMTDDRVQTENDRVSTDDRVMTGDDRAETGLPNHPTEEVSTTEEPLVAPDAVVDFRARWEVIQQGFVDDPRKAVSDADHLVDDLLKRLSDTFDRQQQDLEKQWSDGEPSTEDLRSALRRYRAFFQRLLTL